MNRILTVVLASALLCAPALADTLGDMRRMFSLERTFNAAGEPVPNFTNGYEIEGVDSENLSRLLYSTVAASTAFGGSGANVEANFSTGSYTVPAASLAAGDVIRIRAYVTVPTTVSTDTLRIYVNVGGIAGTAVYDSGAINVSDADLFLADVAISVRTVGATGTMYAVATSQSTQATTFALRAPQAAALSSIDTTASLALTVSAVWSTENANACSLQQFIVTKN